MSLELQKAFSETIFCSAYLHLMIVFRNSLVQS